MTKIELSDGKYTVVNELEEGGGFKALRYGEEWRDLTGDNLVLAMYREIEELREQVAEVEQLRRKVDLLTGVIYDHANGGCEISLDGGDDE